MSYVEHGPRIFMAGRPNDGKPLIYGDYVLPRKRSEGRLKIYDSCSDIRAWSPNSLENSHYFRELTEHASTPGKIIPFNVVIDNVIGLGSQTQSELAACQRELQKYKSLQLTPEQERQLREMDELSVEIHQGTEQPKIIEKTKTLSKKVPVVTREPESSAKLRSYPASQTRSDTCVSIGEPFKADNKYDQDSYHLEPFRTDTIQSGSGSAQSGYRNTPKDLKDVTKKAQATVQRRPMYETSPDRLQSTNTSLQVEVDCTTNDSTIPLDFGPVQSVSSKVTTASTKETRPPSSSDLCSDDEYISGRSKIQKVSRRGRNAKVASGKIVDFESTSDSHEISESEMGTDSGTGTTYGTESETDDETNKAVIIKKDSEIIVLKNELGAKELELEELKELNRNLEIALKEKEDNLIVLKENLKTLQEQLSGMGDQRNYEVQDLKKKIYSSKCLIEQLKDDVAEKSEICCAQSQEIAELRFRSKDAESLRVERDTLARKVDEMGRVAKEADSCNLALKQLKTYLKERDDLKKQNSELACVLADQEKEINFLLDFIGNSSTKYGNRQVKMKGVLEGLTAEIEEKNSKLCQYEKQLISMKQELKLKNSLNSMDEFKIAHEGECNCADVDQDISSKAKKALCKFNLKMEELKEYRIERQNLLKQIEDLKNQVLQGNEYKCSCQGHNSSGFGFDPSPDSGLGFELNQGPHAEYRDNRNGPEDGQTRTQKQLLDMRKRKCALQEELQELERHIGVGDAREGEEVVFAMDDNEDVVANAKRAIDCLKNEMLDLDNWRCEKAAMEDTIEQLKTQIEILNGAKGTDKDEIEGKIVEQASQLLGKMHRLMNELQTYQSERDEMFQRIQCMNDALKDDEIVMSSQGATLLLQRLYEIRNEHKKQCNEYVEQIKSLQKRIDEAEDNFCCAKVTILREKLREALYDASYDGKIDQALATYVKTYIDKIHQITIRIQEAGNERLEIVKEIAKLQQEIDVRNEEIARLKKQMTIYKTKQRGEGDRVNEENSKRIRQLELQLAETTEKLELRDEATRAMKDLIESNGFRISGLNEECSSLKMQIECLVRENSELVTNSKARKDELQMKSNQVVDLLEEMNTLKQTKAAVDEWKKKIEEMEPKLIVLQSENDDLKREMTEMCVLLSERNEYIMRLIEENEQNKKTMENNTVKYKSEIQKKNFEIDKLEKVKLSLDERLNETMEKMTMLNDTVTILRRDNAKVDQISELQRDISKLNKDKKKLESELSNFKSQLQTYEKSNKRLENNLNEMFGLNKILKYEITNLKNNNDRLSSELEHEIPTKEQLITLPNKIYKDIMALKKQLDKSEWQRGTFKNQIDQLEVKSTEDTATINELQRQIKLQDEQTNIQKEKILVMEKANRDLKIELRCRLNELKDLTVRVKKMEKIKLESKSTSSEDKLSKKLSEHLELAKSKSDISLEDMAEVMHSLNHLKNENIQRQTEIEKLTCDIKARNAEIESLRETVKSLTKEKEDLLVKLKDATNQYDSSLMAVKHKYELGVKAIHEKHNESVKRLEAQYEEVMKDTGSLFDSESWLKSLSLNEMAQLHDRICTLTSCMIVGEESKIYALDDQQNEQHQQDLNEKHQLKRKIVTLETEIAQQQHDAQRKMCDLEQVIEREQRELQELVNALAIERRQNLELQKHLHLFSQNQSTLQHYNRNQNPRSRYTSNTDEIDKDITCKQSAYNQDGFLRERHINKRAKELKLMPTFRSTMDEMSDWQRKDFIHQCSIHHKYDNLH